tara:strand:- start:30400 stop:30816 length:417 start_codon:yes stop_codon:yes gene_type:complete
MALQYIAQQRDQRIDLILLPGMPDAACGGVGITGVDYFNADTGAVEPGPALPTAITGVPGAAVFFHQAVDDRRLVAYQVMTADLTTHQVIKRSLESGRGVMQHYVLHAAVVILRCVAGINLQSATASVQQDQQTTKQQ